jgi:hypothetical protein
MAQDFYATVAQASFTLLGLWWVLLQIRYDAWFANIDYRRAVYDISLYFLLPGMMGLGALLAAQQPAIWRGVFGVLGAVGVVESALVIGGMRVLRARGRAGGCGGLGVARGVRPRRGGRPLAPAPSRRRAGAAPTRGRRHPRRGAPAARRDAPRSS